MIEAKTIYNKRYDGDTNKIVDFNTETRVTVDEFLKISGESDLTITLSKPVYEAIYKANVGFLFQTFNLLNNQDLIYNVSLPVL